MLNIASLVRITLCVVMLSSIGCASFWNQTSFLTDATQQNIRGMCGAAAYQNFIAINTPQVSFELRVSRYIETTWIGPLILPLFPVATAEGFLSIHVSYQPANAAFVEEDFKKWKLLIGNNFYSPSFVLTTNSDQGSTRHTSLRFKTGDISNEKEILLRVALPGSNPVPMELKFKAKKDWGYVPILLPHASHCESEP